MWAVVNVDGSYYHFFLLFFFLFPSSFYRWEYIPFLCNLVSMPIQIYTYTNLNAKCISKHIFFHLVCVLFTHSQPSVLSIHAHILSPGFHCSYLYYLYYYCIHYDWYAPCFFGNVFDFIFSLFLLFDLISVLCCRCLI